MRSGLPLFFLSVLLCTAQIRDLRVEPASPGNPFNDRGTRWAVVIGISSYQHLPPGAQLRFAHKDAEEFAAFLRSAAGGAIPADHIRLLTNERADLAQIRAALVTWLTQSAGPRDVVYFFLAGHGVLDEHDEGYFVAHDSDPQNLHATALPFKEVDRLLSYLLRAQLVVMVADACHAGRLGWSSYSPDTPSRAGEPIVRIGQGDRSFLKILASSPSERSFEGEQWAGGHGVFTHELLTGLQGEADRDGDHLVSASEATDFVSRLVPAQTNYMQHPRVAGTFDPRVPLAISTAPPPVEPRLVTVDVSGPANTNVYLDNVFRGKIRSTGLLRIEALLPGPHAFSADFPDGTTLEGTVTLRADLSRISATEPVNSPLAQLRSHVGAGQVLEPNGAWDFYRSHSFPLAEQAAAAALINGALEDLGQACIGDYVQSTATGLKRAMLQRAVDAYARLQNQRPNDSDIEMRKLFCHGRLLIAEGRFAEAVATLENSLKIDSRFACAYNALGVALSRMNRQKEAHVAFETAARLTPEWALPPFQVASQLIAAGDLPNARPYLEKAVRFNPRAIAMHWSLLHVNRLLGRTADVERQAVDLIRLDPTYAPTYSELGLAYEAAGDLAKALEAYDNYVALAPNFADANEIRSRANRIRGQPRRPPPSLTR
jgi:Flp pilus assembly protein TadD